MGVGILGAGVVSSQYVPNLMASNGVELIGVGDIDRDAAEGLAREFGVPKVFSGEDILDCEDIDLIVNLTPMEAHFETNLRILESGKHVYSEKPLASTARGCGILLAAAERAGLSVGCAPDTILGSGFQAGRRAMEDGLIGKPISAFAAMLRPLLAQPRHRVGSFPLFDMAPYYLSALVNLFGSATSVSGITRLTTIAPHADESAIFTSCSIRFEDDVLCSFMLRWGDTPPREVPVLEIYGTKGVMRLPNPDTFAAACFWREHGESTWQGIQGVDGHADEVPNLRGIGIVDLVRSIGERRTPRAAPDAAHHVVEIIEALSMPDRASGAVGGHLQTTCEKPSLLGA